MRIGILALQGAVEPHREKLARLGADAVAVRTGEELRNCHGLVLPGGESTTFLKLITAYSLRQPLVDFARDRPLWGVCAGSILMAERVENPPQESLGVLPVTVRRNAYGRQNESFIAPLALRLPGQGTQSQEGVFIRSPRILQWPGEADVLAEHDGAPVALRHGRHLLTTFHPELSAPDTLHRFFLALCAEESSLPPAMTVPD